MSLAIHSRNFFRPHIIATARRADEAHDLRFIPWPVHNDNSLPDHAANVLGRDTVRSSTPHGCSRGIRSPHFSAPAASIQHDFHEHTDALGSAQSPYLHATPDSREAQR